MDTTEVWTVEENLPNRVCYLFGLPDTNVQNISLRINYDKENDTLRVFYRNPDYHEVVDVNTEDKISPNHLDMECREEDETIEYESGAPRFDQYVEILKRFKEDQGHRLVQRKLELLFENNDWQNPKPQTLSLY